MTSTRRPSSVRSLGARRLKQTTVVMVALGVAGVAGLVVHEAQVAHAATSTSTSTSVTQSTATDGTGTSKRHVQLLGLIDGHGDPGDAPGDLGRLLTMAAGLDVGVDVADDWTALGCAVRVVVSDPDDLGTARRILVAELEAIDRACSRFRLDSELSRLPGNSGRPTPISALLADAVGVALDAAAATDGDVDPTVGVAMEAIGYDRDFARIDIDGAAIRIVSRPVPGWKQVSLDRRMRTLQRAERCATGSRRDRQGVRRRSRRRPDRGGH